MAKGEHKHHRMLSVKELEKLNTKRLLNVLKIARALESNVLNHVGARCCEICNEYIGGDWENDVKKPAEQLTNYKHRIKTILATRENIV
jgi:hypothetical protein